MKHLPGKKSQGFMLLGVLLMLSMGMVAISLTVASLNHLKLSKLRLERNKQAKSQLNRLTRVGHTLMESLMRGQAPDYDEITRQDHWQNFLGNIALAEPGQFSLQAEQEVLHHDLFEPKKLRFSLAIDLHDDPEQMGHRALFSGIYCSGRFALGTVPILLTKESPPAVDYDSPISKITLPNCANASETEAEQKPWFDPVEILDSPLNLHGKSADWPTLGRMLGLELDGPPPEGIYPVWDEGHLCALFVYGSIDRMILSQTEEMQTVTIHAPSFNTTLCYSVSPPSLSLSHLEVNDSSSFAQNIIIIGSIRALEQQGEHGLAPFCRLLVFASGSIRVCSSLTSPPPLPPNKTNGHITLVAASGLPVGGKLVANIILDAGKDLNYDAHLLTTGKIINQNDARIQVQGSISASSIEGAMPQVSYQQAERILPLGPDIRFFKQVYFLGFEGDFDDE